MNRLRITCRELCLLVFVFSLCPGSYADFSPSDHMITTSADGARSVYAADLDGDGDIDVLSASYTVLGQHDHGKVAWYENNGSGQFGSQQVITTAADQPTSVYAGDLDGDGDLDVLSASYFDDKIAWYRNDCEGRSETVAPGGAA